MIKINIFSEADGKIQGFSVSGHSGTADYGQDIVCAGVSSLAQTALLGVGEHLHRAMDYSVASGELRMMLKDKPDDLTESILQTMLLGLKEIAKVSPEAVKIQMQRR